MGMVDISGKAAIRRKAVAVGSIMLKKGTIEAIKTGNTRKGNPLKTAEVAGMLAVKKTPEIIPHCHQIPIEKVEFEFNFEKGIEVKCTVTATAKTGVEMEALIGVTTALNVIWDMVKYLEKEESQYSSTEITGIKVIEKVKGE